jgi:hypothetical protein
MQAITALRNLGYKADFIWDIDTAIKELEWYLTD